MHNLEWWKKALVYQIYPLSFKDSNNDGIGDIKGITQKLDYLKDLGVDVIWLSPVYKSPMDDNGYDISDYLDVNPLFGSMPDLIELINEIHKKDMKIIMDLVVNHTSDEHHWFMDAKSNLNSKYRDYYIWKDQPSPKIDSIFSGSAWEYNEKTNDYYFHLFSKKQPDLNWQNPKLRQEIYKIINTWLSYGIDGFRMDVIELIGKDIDTIKLGDGPFLEAYLEEMYEMCFKDKDIMTVGEMNGLTITRAKELTANKKMGLNMTFQFSHLNIDTLDNMSKWHIKKPDMYMMKKILSKNNEVFKDKGWNALFLSNHDQPRQITRFGNEYYRTLSGQMLMTITLLQKGTAFIYQGEEIGMTGIKFDNINDYKDIETINWYKEAKDLKWPHEKIMESIYSKGRDNSRTPFQWNDKINAGFSEYEPWLMINPNYKEVNLESELKSPHSVYNYTKKLISLRKNNLTLINGDFKLLFDNDPNNFIFLRKDISNSFLVINNMTADNQYVDLSAYKDYDLLLSNQEINLSKKTLLKPYLSAVFKRK